jgi:hypothetical protein
MKVTGETEDTRNCTVGRTNVTERLKKEETVHAAKKC